MDCIRVSPWGLSEKTVDPNPEAPSSLMGLGLKVYKV